MTTETTPKVTRLDQIKSEILETYADQFKKATELGTKGDLPAMSKAIMDIQQEISTKAADRVSQEKKNDEAKVASESAGKTALELHAQDVFKEPAAAIMPGFEKLETVGQVIVRFEKDKAGKGSYTVLVGNLTKVGTGNGVGRHGPRNHTLTVNGKEYETVALAWKDVMPGVDQPSKSIGKGAGAKQSKTKDVAVAAMVKAGHQVS